MTAPALPIQAAELEEMLADPARMKALFTDDGAARPEFGEFIANYARAVNNKDQSIATQVREETQRMLAGWLKDNGQDVARPDLTPDAPVARRNRGQHHNPKAPGAILDGKFASTGDLLTALYGERRGTRADVERMSELRNAYSTQVPAEGGFLVPEEFRAELLAVALETALVRPRARVVPMATSRIKFPMVDSTSNASSVYGGVIGYWTEEAAALTASSSTFGSVALDANKLTGYAEIPNELLADSAISVTGFVDQVFPEALAWFEDVAFIRGTGVGEPQGFLHAGNAASVSVAKETGQVAATIVWENIVKAYSRMLPTSLGRAVWLCHIDTFPELATMALSVGTGGSAIWLNNGAVGPPMTILGRPVIFSEKMESVGTAGDVNFVDFGYYLIGDRQQLQAMTSEHFKFSSDTTAYRIIERLDGRPWLRSAITPNKGSSTLSPFVKVATRS